MRSEARYRSRCTKGPGWFQGLTALLLLSTATAAWAADCDALYEAHLKTDLDLSYEAFDQTEGQGFRPLAGECPAEAANLIEAYIEHNEATQGSLMWHVAQLRASAGDNVRAIEAAQRCLREEDTGDFMWNDYVQATIAFLAHDYDSLLKHRDAVASRADVHPGNAINLKLINALVTHFGQSYAYATSRIE